MSRRNRPRMRARAMGAAVLVAATLAACGGGSGDSAANGSTSSGATTTEPAATTTPAPTTTADPKAEVEAAYLAYWAELGKLGLSPSADISELETYAAGALLEDVQSDVRSRQ